MALNRVVRLVQGALALVKPFPQCLMVTVQFGDFRPGLFGQLGFRLAGKAAIGIAKGSDVELLLVAIPCWCECVKGFSVFTLSRSVPACPRKIQ